MGHAKQQTEQTELLKAITNVWRHSGVHALRMIYIGREAKANQVRSIVHTKIGKQIADKIFLNLSALKNWG